MLFRSGGRFGAEKGSFGSLDAALHHAVLAAAPTRAGLVALEDEGGLNLVELLQQPPVLGGSGGLGGGEGQKLGPPFAKNWGPGGGPSHKNGGFEGFPFTKSGGLRGCHS